MILFITQNFLPDVGGTQRYVTDLADSLAAHGHAVEVYCRQTSRNAARTFDATRTYAINRFGGLRLWRQWQGASALLRRIEQGGVTAVIADTWKSLEILPAEGLRGVRVMCLAHGNEYLSGNRAKAERIRRSLAKADVVAANSNFTADLARPFARDGAVQLLLPGIAAPAGAASAAPPLPSANNAPLLCIARLEPRKGVDQVIRALAQLKSAHPHLSLDIVGKGADKGRLVGLTSKLGVADRVRFHGYISDAAKADLLRHAALFVLPNRREGDSVEGFGLVFLEAAAFGVPSLAGHDGGTGDAVLDGRTGLVVDGEDLAGVTAALDRLLGDDALRRGMGLAAHARFWSEFVWDSAVGRFEAALDLPRLDVAKVKAL